MLEDPGDTSGSLSRARQALLQIKKNSLCEMQSFANPPVNVKVAFGIFLNFFLENAGLKNENGIVDYKQVKMSVNSNPTLFLSNTTKLLDMLETGEYSSLVSRLERMCIAISKNIELYYTCVQKAEQ